MRHSVRHPLAWFLLFASLVIAPGATSRGCCAAAESSVPLRISGINPRLAYFNKEGECGTGAVVPWADRLWVITYAPHKPQGSTDKLYEITPDESLIVRPESIGGTPANRMIHRESNQLFIGPYVIDAERHVRVIPPSMMYGRMTGNARHLLDPAGKIYFATMEEGIYEVDVNTLDVMELWRDEQQKGGRHADLPGYHGKGLYSAHGRLVYANNGEHGERALREPNIPSGVLASWDGQKDSWDVVRRNQFTEVTGPGGIYGNSSTDDPLWSIGWDHRSLLLAVLDADGWHTYRLPKSSHSYDGAHGWNTEWPRIRDIGKEHLLMTMHGAFWKFPRSFTSKSSSGIAPRSNYLKVVGDFCRWRDEVVLGCDDAAHSEFLNKRKLKGKTIPAGQSQSNLCFLKPEQLDDLGPVLGRGAVWWHDVVMADVPSDPYLFAGYAERSLWLSHGGAAPVTMTLQVDREGTGAWETLKELTVPAGKGLWHEFAPGETGTWIRLVPRQSASSMTAQFQYANADSRRVPDPRLVAGLLQNSASDATGGLLHARGADLRTLRFVARSASETLGGYELNGDLQLVRREDAAADAYVVQNLAVPENIITVDEASVLYIDDAGKRWRLPKAPEEFAAIGPLGPERVCREVCTERDLLNIQGTFYELPAENAGGFARLRPVSTHLRRISDFTSYRGLLVMSGVQHDAVAHRDHIVVSDDGRCALWVGSVDDLWKFGKPRGLGGPWNRTKVEANRPSDPYLMTGYDQKRCQLSHGSDTPVRMRIEADFTGLGDWTAYQELDVRPGQTVEYQFPEAFHGYWIRMVSDTPTTATATFIYE